MMLAIHDMSAGVICNHPGAPRFATAEKAPISRLAPFRTASLPASEPRLRRLSNPLGAPGSSQAPPLGALPKRITAHTFRRTPWERQAPAWSHPSAHIQCGSRRTLFGAHPGSARLQPGLTPRHTTRADHGAHFSALQELPWYWDRNDGLPFRRALRPLADGTSTREEDSDVQQRSGINRHASR